MTKNSYAENFLELLDESFKAQCRVEGTVVKGTIIGQDKDAFVIDVGLKSEGRIPTREFGSSRGADLKIGDVIDVFVERMENREGEIVLSRDKARREAAWEELEVMHKKGEHVTGVITSRVKGGFTVDLSGATAFLPGSQIDVRPIKDTNSLMNIEQPFVILKMDRLRGNIVVSRRAILEESMVETRKELMSTIQEGSILEGAVKNITDYGAFIDLGGVDGLLHVTDISWSRVNHPSDVFQVGDIVKVMVIKINENNRISLGVKQLQDDPWKSIENKYHAGMEVDGIISNIADYGAFVGLESGIEGLIYNTELSWTKKNVHPSKVVSIGDKVKVRILEVDRDKRRISLGLKQCTQNPWESFAEKYPEGSIIEGEVKNFTEFGLFVGLDGDIDGMVHISDLSWDKPTEEAVTQFTKGQKIKVKVLDVSAEKERISLGIKQLQKDPFVDASADVKMGEVVTCTITNISDRGLDVVTEKGATSFIRKVDLAKDRSEQRPERFAIGERIDAQVMSVDAKSRKVTLSIKAREVTEERAAMAEYGSSDSGASLGDILGAAFDLGKIQKASQKAEEGTEAAEPKAKKSAVKKAPAKKTKAAKED
ncbi:MAG: 30S ribosomal protein S1 [Alphaproteobacteria bacterium RIFCSPLOWO2_01_FULL_45_8]|nr:MAG: 30S ribosomal protein S1 [Alphaproteobacteria bacterium GWB1_45_5]OFW76558.1 MAG: 30S ribosomal protein S1 [Alphaproteobacteria bacterium GWA1_45_9]OFW89642.1 MAG: 30S ribosomal protein S1 [Alphaproteobacteria bacterium RIFCSPHIGHO2_01_FULL_41_14]OFW96575.1 MAG: 30S ribosomal protein S1 [Alphaproteobacteria bacterium RIFCSPLOWO2_01_FULL_45_8]